MPRGKLILICQSGGEFVAKEDGCLSYIGGEAHALDINSDTLFDHLKLKLAEMCDLEYTSLSLKYFLPGNKRTLITLSNDKDLRRMYDFHGDSVTADVFVMGQEGFNHEAFDMYAGSHRWCEIKPAEIVNPTIPSPIAATIPTVAPDDVASPTRCKLSSNSISTVKAKAPPPTRVVLAITSKRRPTLTVANDPRFSIVPRTDIVAVPTTENALESVIFDMNASPADTVKKRRRTASWKIGASGSSIVSLDDAIEISEGLLLPRTHLQNFAGKITFQVCAMDIW